MRRMIKCYLTFSTRLYRLIVFLLLPLLAVITAVLLGGLAAMFVLLSAEILADRLSFGGIAARGVGLPEYIKSSHRGLSVMRSALVCNLFRQLIYIAAVTAGCIGLGAAKGVFCMTGDLWMQAFDLCLLAAVLMAAFVTVVRFFELTWAGLIASTVADVVFIAGIVLVGRSPVLMAALLLPAAVVVPVMGLRVIERRLERSYYDEIDETGV